MATQTIFTDWKPGYAEQWGHVPLKVAHALHQSPLFTLDAIAELIDAYPRQHYSLIHMGAQGGRRFWKEGELGGLKGRDVIDWIAQGRMWLNLRSVRSVDRRYADLLDAAYEEIAVRAPGAPMFNTSMGILVSSPKAQVYYHCDLPGQALWQIHGRKRILIYPTDKPFLAPENLEDIALFGIEEDVPYHDWFDAHATVLELGPGDMAHWPLNAPHRVENHDMLNVSLTSEHWSDEIVRRHKVNLANGFLRHRFGYAPRSRALSGPGYAAKAVLQGVMRRMKWVEQKRSARRPIEFKLDAATRGGVVAFAPQGAFAPLGH
ncbi:MAG: hypothetical protein IT548_16680 [Alphaproteobacteria bacterium]|nr:hypothetical protein [Alphaproteobacteria bacterium]